MKNTGLDIHFLNEVISNLCGIVFIIDFETHEYIWDNGQYYKILGYKDDEILKNSFEFAEHYFHPNDRSIVQDMIKYFKTKENIEWSGVYSIRHKKGHWVWLYSRVKVLTRNEEGNPKQLLGEIIDVFERFHTANRIMVRVKEKLKTDYVDSINRLTNREIEIIFHIAKGLTYKEISEKLFISPETVNKHRKNILQKLELKNIAALSSFAIKHGLV